MAESKMEARFTKNIVGYLDPLSVCAGETLNVFVSCESAGPFQARLVQLLSGDARPHGTGFHEIEIDSSFERSYAGEHQPSNPGSYAVLPGLPASDGVGFACYFYPTLLEANEQTLVHGGGFSVRISDKGIVVAIGAQRIDVAAPLRQHRWHRLVASAGREVAVRIDVLPLGPAEPPQTTRFVHPLSVCAFTGGDWELAREAPGHGHFNGRIEAVRIYGAPVDVSAALHDLDSPRPSRPGLDGAWDFSIGIDTQMLTDVSGHNRHGRLQQMPTRAVRGVKWRGNVFNWREDPAQYAAIHFHDDDLADAQWQPTIRWTIPAALPSAVYAVKLSRGDSEDYVPFFVRPGPEQPRQRVAYLASTATYLAYANQKLGFSSGVYVPRKSTNANDAYLQAHPEVGCSLYDHHRDGSGVHYSSRLRPVLNLKPKNIPWAFTADTNLLAWLHAIGQAFDVVTDEDLHREGAAALDGYAAVITGTHPEYHSTQMLDALAGWLDSGGRLMYMGGNGFYWRIAYCPDNPAIIEVRRAEDGTRAWIAEPGEYYHAFTGEYGGLWRRIGRPPNQLVGIGFAAQGFDGGTHYRLTDHAEDPRVAFIMEGLEGRTIIGAHGTQGGGAAGEEIDRYDPSLGSPRHALVIASSENHRPGMLRVKEEFFMMRPLGDDPDVRADMSFFETRAGGAVFSTGSISYAGALSTNGYDNDIARLTGNVLRRFIDPAPFRFPDDAVFEK
jgi:N,N-dimethylformamidase